MIWLAIIIVALAALWRLNRWACKRWARLWYCALWHGAVLLILLSAGCATTTPASADDPQGIPVVEPYTNCQRLAIVVGVSIADSPAYNGRLECPGADIDCWRVSGKLYRLGVTNVIELLDLAATRKAILSALDHAAKMLYAGDLLIFYVSGHGAQVPDYDGDEEDGLDEVFCAADGLLTDDEKAAALAKFRPGVRVDAGADTCHAATGWRERGLRLIGRRKPVPLTLDAAELRHLEITEYAMCAADQSSWGDAINGGVGTGHLLAAMDGDPDMRRWPGFLPFWTSMPAKQKPVYTQSSGTTDRMRYGRIWE